jgi:hypothetical protein
MADTAKGDALTTASIDHPSVDADLRANSTETMNRIDFNDPASTGPAPVATPVEEAPAKAGK